MSEVGAVVVITTYVRFDNRELIGVCVDNISYDGTRLATRRSPGGVKVLAEYDPIGPQNRLDGQRSYHASGGDADNPERTFLYKSRHSFTSQMSAEDPPRNSSLRSASAPPSSCLTE